MLAQLAHPAPHDFGRRSGAALRLPRRGQEGFARRNARYALRSLPLRGPFPPDLPAPRSVPERPRPRPRALVVQVVLVGAFEVRVVPDPDELAPRRPHG